MIVARRILFYLFMTVYAVVCPALIFYSFGYIFHPVKKEISHTGLIHLATIPPGADIYLGTSRYKYKTPASITELLPGQYQVTLRLKKYRPWTHNVSIAEGKAAAFGDVILIPKELNPQPVLPDSDYQSFITVAHSDDFILKKSSQLRSFYSFDWKKEAAAPLLKNSAPYDTFPVSAVYPEEGGKDMIVYGGSLWEKKFYLVKWAGRKRSVIDITKLLHGSPTKIIWDAEEKDSCFAVYDDYVDRLDLKKMSVYPQFIDRMKGFGTSGKWLYILGEDNRISKMMREGGQRTVVFEDTYFGKELFERSRFYRIRMLNDDVFLFMGNAGDLIVTLPPYDILSSGLVGVDFDTPGGRLLYWTKNTIWTADFKWDDTKNTLFSDRIRLRTVYEKGKNISQCFWVYKGSHVIFKDKDRVFLLELAPDGAHHVEPLVEVKSDSEIFYFDETGYLYYLSPEGQVMKLKIISDGDENLFREG